MTLTQLLPLVRHGLQILGGVLVASGYFTEEMMVSVSGLVMNALTLYWYLKK